MGHDPGDLPTASPGPSPTPTPASGASTTDLSNNPMADTPSTEPIFIAYPGENPAASAAGDDPPKDFVTMVNVALQGRLGITKYGLIPAADKKELIDKIWNDPSVQNYSIAN